MLKGPPIPTDEEANAIVSQTAMIKFPLIFVSPPLPCLSVFDFKCNYWINLAHSAIPKELESQFHVISATKNSQSSPEHLSNVQMQRVIWSLPGVDDTEALANPRRVLIK